MPRKAKSTPPIPMAAPAGAAIGIPNPMALPLPPPVEEPELLLPDPLDEETLRDRKEHLKAYWQACHDRQAEDIEVLCWGVGAEVEGKTGRVIEADPNLPADPSIQQQFSKNVTTISGGQIQLDCEIDDPNSTDLIEKGEAGWRYTERQFKKQHVRAGRGKFDEAETRYAVREGFVCQRLWFNRKKYLNGKFPIEHQMVDPKTVSYWEGVDGLDLVVQELSCSKHDAMVQFPQLGNLDDLPPQEGRKSLLEKDLHEGVDLDIVYDRDYAYVFIDDAYAGEIYHGFGLVPFVIIPCRSFEEPFGYQRDINGRTSYRTTNVGTNPEFAFTRFVGVSCFHEMKGVVRFQIGLKSMLVQGIENKLLEVLTVEGPDPTTIRTTLEPAGRINVPPGYKVEPLKRADPMPEITTLTQGNTHLLGRDDPDSAYGNQVGTTSGWDRAYASNQAANKYQPYAGGREEAAIRRWLMVLQLYVNLGIEQLPLTFGVERAEGQMEPESLTRSEMEELLDAEWKATIGNLIPQERMQLLTAISSLAQTGLYDEETLLELANEPNPKKIMRRKRAQAFTKSIPVLTVAEQGEALAHVNPDLWVAFGKEMFQAAIRKTKAESLSATEQAEHNAAMVHAMGGLPPGQPPGAPPGAGGNPVPSPPPSGPPGGRPVAGPTPRIGPPPPPVVSQPGMAAAAAGVGGRPGGVPLPPGAPTNVAAPAAMGQIATPPGTNPVLDQIRELQRRGRGQ